MTYITKLSENGKISQNQDAQSDPVDAEGSKAALADIFHKTLDDDEAEAMMAEEGIEITEVDEDDGTVDLGEEF